MHKYKGKKSLNRLMKREESMTKYQKNRKRNRWKKSKNSQDSIYLSREPKMSEKREVSESGMVVVEVSQEAIGLELGILS